MSPPLSLYFKAISRFVSSDISNISLLFEYVIHTSGTRLQLRSTFWSGSPPTVASLNLTDHLIPCVWI